MSAHLLADIFVSLAALIGVVLLLARLRAPERRGPMTDRFAFALGTVAALLIFRVGYWVTDWLVFSRLSVAAAALIPLGAVLVVEGFLLRHAPLVLKLWVAVGAVAFAVGAFMPVGVLDGYVTYALFAFQLVALSGVAAMVVWRDREGLSAAQDRAVVRVGLSLAIIVPFLVTDYRDLLDLPVRLGGVAILVLTWLALTQERVRDGLVTLAVLVGVALAAGLAIMLTMEGGAADFVRVAAIVLCAMLLGRLVLALADARESAGDDLTAALARARTDDVETFLTDLRDHPAVRDARLLGPGDLADLDAERLAAAFDALPVRRKGQGAQLDFLLDSHGATHAFRVRRVPPLVAVLRLSEMDVSGAPERDLALVQRMAEAVAGRSTRRDQRDAA